MFGQRLSYSKMIIRSKLSWKSYWTTVLKYGDKLISHEFLTVFFRGVFGLDSSGVSAKPTPLASVSLTNKYYYWICNSTNDDCHFPVNIICRQHLMMHTVEQQMQRSE